MKKYTVVVKEITSTDGKFNRKRFNNVKGSIIKFLVKHSFSFQVGIANHTVNMETAKNYIEVYLKSDFFIADDKKSNRNAVLNLKLMNKLGGSYRYGELVKEGI